MSEPVGDELERTIREQHAEYLATDPQDPSVIAIDYLLDRLDAARAKINLLDKLATLHQQGKHRAEAELARLRVARGRLLEAARNVDQVLVDQRVDWTGLKRAELSAYLKCAIAAAEAAPQEGDAT